MMSNPLYVFDMDDTLINGDCAMIWNQFLVQKGMVDSDKFLEQDRHMMALYAEGKMDMESYLEFAMSPLINLPSDHVNRLAIECVEQDVLPRLFSRAKLLIEQLNQRNVDMLIISATVSFIVHAVGRRIGIPETLGIDMIEENGCYTAKIDGIPSYREGKVTRLNAWLASQSQHYSEIHFYTDSINDLPLCERADFVYLVNPCKQLLALPDRENWQKLQWD